MYRRPLLWVQTIVLVASPLCLSGNCLASDLSQFLHAVFDDQLQRPPTGQELHHHAGLHRNDGPLASYIDVCSSDEFFQKQARRDYATYVTRLYNVFLGRSPRPDELRFWVIQFQQGNVSRRDLVRGFLQANRVTQLPSLRPVEPAFRVPNTAREISVQLVAQLTLFNSLLRTDVGSSAYGAAVIREARQVLAVARQYQLLVQGDPPTRAQLQISTDNLLVALQRLESDFYQVPGASPHSQVVLQHISQLVAAARSTPVPRPQQPVLRPTPPGIRPPSPIPGYVAVVNLRDSIRRFTAGLRDRKNARPSYASFYRNAQSLLVQVEALERLMRNIKNTAAHRGAMEGVVIRANQLSAEVDRLDMRAQQGWWSVQADLRRAARAVGAKGVVQVQSTRPVIINRPAWAQLPYQPTPSAPSRRNATAIRLADDLTAKIQRYVSSLRPIARQNPNAARLIGSLQDLEHSVRRFRQSAAEGAYGSQLTRASDSLMRQYQRTADVVTKLVSQDATLNSPLFYQIGELTQKLRYAVTGLRIGAG